MQIQCQYAQREDRKPLHRLCVAIAKVHLGLSRGKEDVHSGEAIFSVDISTQTVTGSTPRYAPADSSERAPRQPSVRKNPRLTHSAATRRRRPYAALFALSPPVTS